MSKLNITDRATLRKNLNDMTDAEIALARLRVRELVDDVGSSFSKDVQQMIVADLSRKAGLIEERKPKATAPFEVIDIFAEIDGEANRIRPREQWKVAARPVKRKSAWDD